MSEWTPLRIAQYRLEAARLNVGWDPDDLRVAEVAAQVAQAEALDRIAASLNWMTMPEGGVWARGGG